jgi:hypothetical protein
MKEKDTVEMVIGIQIRDTKILLSEEDAKALYAKLHEMFGKKVEVQKEYVPYNPWYVPNPDIRPTPVWVSPLTSPWRYEVWCGSTTFGNTSNTCTIDTTKTPVTGSTVTYKL